MVVGTTYTVFLDCVRLTQSTHGYSTCRSARGGLDLVAEERAGGDVPKVIHTFSGRDICVDG